MNYRFSDEVLVILAQKWYIYIDEITDVFRQISLMTEKEFRLRYQKDKSVRIGLHDGSFLRFSIRFQGGIAYVYEIQIG